MDFHFFLISTALLTFIVDSFSQIFDEKEISNPDAIDSNSIDSDIFRDLIVNADDVPDEPENWQQPSLIISQTPEASFDTLFCYDFTTHDAVTCRKCESVKVSTTAGGWSLHTKKHYY